LPYKTIPESSDTTLQELLLQLANKSRLKAANETNTHTHTHSQKVGSKCVWGGEWGKYPIGTPYVALILCQLRDVIGKNG